LTIRKVDKEKYDKLIIFVYTYEARLLDTIREKFKIQNTIWPRYFNKKINLN